MEKKSVLSGAFLLIAFFISSAYAVSINEIESNPYGSDTRNEWVELYSENLMDLDGWKLVNNDNQSREIEGSFQGYFIINFNTQWLDNTGETIGLYNGSELIDFVGRFNDSDNDNHTWQYCDGDWSFLESSKGKENDCYEEEDEEEEEEDTSSLKLEWEEEDIQNTKEFEVDVKALDLLDKDYDIQIYIYDSYNNVISEVYDSEIEEWKSSSYFIPKIFVGPGNKTQRVRLRIKESYSDFCGDADIRFRIKESENSSIIAEENYPIKVLDGGSGENGNCIKTCNKDSDCSNLICPQVLGQDTPRCNSLTQKCYCGSSNNSSCFKNSDCGVNFISDYFCIEQNLTRSWINFSCINPWRENAYCINFSGNFTIQDCAWGCNNSECIGINDVLIIFSPMDGKIYNANRIYFHINSILGEKIEYIDYAIPKPKWSALCTSTKRTSCYGYKGQKLFSDGQHNLTVLATGIEDSHESTNVSFFIDSKRPIISKIFPNANSFTNGSGFYVKYTEENLKEISITYNPTEVIKECNKSGKNQECWFNLNLSKFNGQEIEYFIKITDVAENMEESKKTKLKVDTKSPVINNPNEMLKEVNKEYAYLSINITELNLYRVEYLDINDPRGKWKTACLRLDKNGLCEKKIRFAGSNPKIQIRVIDKAGNSADVASN